MRRVFICCQNSFKFMPERQLWYLGTPHELIPDVKGAVEALRGKRVREKGQFPFLAALRLVQVA